MSKGRARSQVAGMLVAGFLLVGGRSEAQVLGTPVFSAPYRAFKTTEVGGALSFPTGASVAAEGFYSFGYREYDIGLHGGFSSLSNNGPTQLLLGVSGRGRVVTHSEQFPLDGALTVGFGVASGGGTTTGIFPVGLSLGRRFVVEGSRTSIVPYVQPVLAIRVASGTSSAKLALGFGVDVRLNDQLDLRVSAGVGTIEGIGIGLAWVR